MKTDEEIVKVQKEYCDYIIELIKKPDFPMKLQNLNTLITKYYEFCKKYQVDPFYKPLNSALSTIFITDCKPLLFDIDPTALNLAIIHLQEVIENNQNNLQDGIFPDEANLLMNYIVQNTRKNFIEYFHVDLNTESLKGCCKLSQEISLNLCKTLGLSITVNDDTIFTNRETPSHFFGTVAIPVKENSKITIRYYLVDVTYRQFFSLNNCHAGLELFNYSSLPDVGYYMMKKEEQKLLAEDLLKNGFIPLDTNAAKEYGMGFIMKYFHTVPEIVLEYQEMAPSNFLEKILNQEKELILTAEKLNRLGYHIEIPTQEKKL